MEIQDLVAILNQERETAIVIFFLALIWMLFLALKDHKSLKAGNHVDMKSVIVSIGVLGTFIGIAIGLWEFNTSDIDNSVPNLLEGLKLAFATSIAGMTISIILSTIQKDQLTGGDDELSVLGQINDKLSGIVELNEQVKGLRLEVRDEQKSTRALIEKGNNSLANIATEDSIKNFRIEAHKRSVIRNKFFEDSIKNFRIEVHEEQLKSRSFLEEQFSATNKTLEKANTSLGNIATEDSIKNFRIEVHEEQLKSRSFLEEQFSATNKTLEKAIEVLSRGATEEIIKALENVISDFNKNLVDQFGDNFKQLNEAVVNLLKWQEQFKDIVEKDHGLLVAIRSSLESSSGSLEKISSRNEEVQKVYEQLKSLINTYDNQVTTLNKQLEEFSKMGTKATEVFNVLNTGFEKVQSGMGEQSEALSRLTKDIAQKLPESLGQLENTLVGLTKQFGEDYEAFLKNYRKLIK